MQTYKLIPSSMVPHVIPSPTKKKFPAFMAPDVYYRIHDSKLLALNLNKN